ncbi:hypothetical protein [Asticcacaulis benevestitus]|uniref:Hydrazine synthase alpha subunit middle domain-containing protein n=1 Tax=Asticcacaulis benevestitus DSM 16100 = ATCC BAA-896 TaxID=1121022 RepID=V4PUE8_9CAUL|nr:hypothetical protein [Asticcacaulis benevestitus]ESQ89165.1 hypothetical protein ABENE_14420 [Asticcacaulis benevestitus DSM 16100 = ATCC BAA-896]
MIRTSLCILGWLVAGAANAANPLVDVEGGNIVCHSGGRTTFLTRDGQNSEPVLSSDGQTIAFIHHLKSNSDPEFPQEAIHALWIGNCRTGKAHQLRAPTSANDIFASVGHPVFSLEGGYVYVSLAPGGDSLIIRQVSVSTGQQKFVANAGLVGVFRNGPYRGYLLATQHTDLTDAHGNHFGGYPYYIFKPNGQIVTRIADSETWDDKTLKGWLSQKGWRIW